MKQILGGMLIAGAVTLYAMALYNTAWLSDDAYISYRSVDNLVHGYGLTWNTDERVQAFTNPLWVLANVPAYLGVKAPWQIYFSGLATSAVTALLAVTVMALGVAETPMVAVFGVVALAFSRAYMDYSTSGLENPLTHLLLALFVLYAMRLRWTMGTLFSMSLCAGLSLVNRMDTALLFAPVLAYAWLAERNLRATLAIAAGMLPFFAWEVFSVVYYGFPFPNTAYAKLGTGIETSEVLFQGVWYLWNALQHDPLTIVLIAAGLLGAPFVLRQGRYTALALGGLLYVLYLVEVGGDFMQGRLLTPVLTVAVLLVLRIPRGGWFTWGTATAIAVMFACLAPGVPLFDRDNGTRRAFDAHRVADERNFWMTNSGLKYWRNGIEFPAHEYAATGRKLASLDRYQAEVFGSVGFRGFFAGPKVHIIDHYALADPLLARMPAIYSPEWRIGHFIRYVPVWYVDRKKALAATLEGKAGKDRVFNVDEVNAIVPVKEDAAASLPDKPKEGERSSPANDPALQAYYDRLELIVRGPLWIPARWKAILNMNLGQYDYLVARDTYRFPELAHKTLAELSTPRPVGTKWDAPGNVVLRRSGVEIQLGNLAHNAFVELSADHDDTYRLLFMNAGKIVDKYDVLPTAEDIRGLQVYQVTVPNAAIRAGYDAIRVIAYGGDKKASIGHLLLR